MSADLRIVQRNKLKTMIINGLRKDLHELYIALYGDQIYHGSAKAAAASISDDLGITITDRTIKNIRTKHKFIKKVSINHNEESTLNSTQSGISEHNSNTTSGVIDKRLEFINQFKPIEPDDQSREVRVSGLKFK